MKFNERTGWYPDEDIAEDSEADLEEDFDVSTNEASLLIDELKVKGYSLDQHTVRDISIEDTGDLFVTSDVFLIKVPVNLDKYAIDNIPKAKYGELTTNDFNCYYACEFTFKREEHFLICNLVLDDYVIVKKKAVTSINIDILSPDSIGLASSREILNKLQDNVNITLRIK